MKVEISVSENTLGENGISFTGDNNEELYFIPFRQILGIETNYKVTPDSEIIGDVLLRVIRLAASYSWATEEILIELLRLIHNYKPDLKDDILADTFIAVSRIKGINLLAIEFEKQNPIQNYEGTEIANRTEWRKKFFEYLKTKR